MVSRNPTFPRQVPGMLVANRAIARDRLRYHRNPRRYQQSHGRFRYQWLQAKKRQAAMKKIRYRQARKRLFRHKMKTRDRFRGIVAKVRRGLAGSKNLMKQFRGRFPERSIRWRKMKSRPDYNSDIFSDQFVDEWEIPSKFRNPLFR